MVLIAFLPPWRAAQKRVSNAPKPKRRAAQPAPPETVPSTIPLLTPAPLLLLLLLLSAALLAHRFSSISLILTQTLQPPAVPSSAIPAPPLQAPAALPPAPAAPAPAAPAPEPASRTPTAASVAFTVPPAVRTASAGCAAPFADLVIADAWGEQRSAAAALQQLGTARRPQWDGPAVLGAGSSWRYRLADEACALLNSHGGVAVVMVGDSLSRHFSDAVVALLRGDVRLGAIWGSPEELQDCTCDKQFDHGASLCAAHSHALNNEKALGLCGGGSTARPVVLNFPDAGVEAGIRGGYKPDTLAALDAHFSGAAAVPHTLLAIFRGIHFDYDAEASIREGLEPLISNHLPRWRSTAPPGSRITPLVVLSPYPGPNKPAQYLPQQGRGAVEAHNSRVGAWAAAAGVAVFPTAALAENATSPDGTHLGAAVNIAMAQGLLAYMDAALRDGEL